MTLYVRGEVCCETRAPPGRLTTRPGSSVKRAGKVLRGSSRSRRTAASVPISLLWLRAPANVEVKSRRAPDAAQAAARVCEHRPKVAMLVLPPKTRQRSPHAHLHASVGQHVPLAWRRATTGCRTYSVDELQALGGGKPSCDI